MPSIALENGGLNVNRANLVVSAKASVKRGSQSFALASRLFTKPIRERVWLLYAWCRQCDDLADGQDHGHKMTVAKSPERSQKRTIAAMRMLTTRALGGEQTGRPAFDAIGVVAQECRLPDHLVYDVIDGFALDADGWRPQTEDDLYQYCYHVAGAVGCLMAIIMGVPGGDKETLDRACDLGLAFQLSNIARDVAEDAAAGRCYLPKDWLAEKNIDPGNLMAAEHRSAMIELVTRLCDQVEQYEASARIGAARLPFRSRWAVLAAAGIYGDIARTVKAGKGASLKQRVVTTKSAKALWIVKALGQAMRKPQFATRAGLWSRRVDTPPFTEGTSRLRQTK